MRLIMTVQSGRLKQRVPHEWERFCDANTEFSFPRFISSAFFL